MFQQRQQTWFLLFLFPLLVWTNPVAKEPGDPSYSDCNICGCEDCFVYKPHARAKFFYKDRWWQFHCEDLETMATNRWTLDPDFCWNTLPNYTLNACTCAWPNGTMIWDTLHPAGPLRLPDTYPDKYVTVIDGHTVIAQQDQAHPVTNVDLKGHYTLTNNAGGIPDAKYFGGAPGSYEAILSLRQQSSMAISLNAGYFTGLTVLVVVWVSLV